MSFACYIVLSLYGAYLSSAAPVVQTVAPIVHAIAQTVSTSDANLQIHDQLVSETMQLNQVEKTTLDSYRLNRFHDPDATAENINIIGLPIASELSLNTRLMATVRYYFI
ncbi:uncharacterized protein LOC117111469 [Anneissia japonica]|uniref:uncharacterized protein LOC117111469 n=1 Tax=Anneissia japonica TaxID=1529436 RepID=UPI0014259E92|nr:uncharacterized protein LOC117111469 [Anneissia japonica]